MRWFQTGDVRADVPLRLHNVDPSLRFWPKVEKTETCWLWKGTKARGGYGAFRLGKMILAHRFAWTVLVGPIPETLELDHLCRVPACVNPAHLELVTAALNQSRTRKEYCHKGHPLSGDNVMMAKGKRRGCRTCNKERAAAWYRANGHTRRD